MKQLSALGVRRQFYRNPRRLRALRPGEEMADDMGQPGFNYFVGMYKSYSNFIFGTFYIGSTTVVILI